MTTEAAPETEEGGSWRQAVGPDGATRTIPEAVAKRVWIAAGGRCTFCKKHLLVDEVTGQDIMIGQLAHIAGWTTAKGSPRGGSSLPVPERNTAGNLMLMCHDQHKVIDDRSLWDVYDEETLKRFKRKHEEAIRRLGGLLDTSSTTVTRVVGAVGDIAVQLDRRTVARALLDRDLFPDYALLGYDKEVEVDLRPLGSPETNESYWTAVQSVLNTFGERIRRLTEAGDVHRLSVLALARIPALVALGGILGEGIDIDLYPTRRRGDEGFGWTDGVPTATFDVREVRSGAAHGSVAVAVSISGPVDVDQVAAEVSDDVAIHEIVVTSGTPDAEVICSQASLDNFSQTWRRMLTTVESHGVEHIDVFPAVPVTAAIAMGRLLMRGGHPPLRVFDLRHDTRRYEYALEVRR